MIAGEDLSVILIGRAALYRCFQAVFGGEPAPEVVEPFANGNFRTVLQEYVRRGEAIAGSCLTDECGSRLDSLLDSAEKGVLPARVASKVDSADSGAMNQLEVAYGRLFVGPGTIEAAPWESVYLDGDGTLFRPSTLEVRKAYVGQGFIPRNYPHVADDHIGLELDFMRLLADRMKLFDGKGGNSGTCGDGARGDEACGDKTCGDGLCGDEGDIAEMPDGKEGIGCRSFTCKEEYDAAILASQMFLDEHLLVWVPLLQSALQKAPHGFWYSAVALLLNEFLVVDRAVLEML